MVRSRETCRGTWIAQWGSGKQLSTPIAVQSARQTRSNTTTQGFGPGARLTFRHDIASDHYVRMTEDTNDALAYRLALRVPDLLGSILSDHRTAEPRDVFLAGLEGLVVLREKRADTRIMLTQTARWEEKGNAIAKATIAYRHGQIAVLEAETWAAVAANPERTEQFGLLASMPGVGLVPAATLMSRMPEPDGLGRHQAAAPVAVAPFAAGNGQSRGVRYTSGGRRRPRNVSFTAATSASRHNRDLKALHRWAEGRRQRARSRDRRGHVHGRDPRQRTCPGAAIMDPGCSEPGVTKGGGRNLANEAADGSTKWTTGEIGCDETSDAWHTRGTEPDEGHVRASKSPRVLLSGHGCSTPPLRGQKGRGGVTMNLPSPDVAAVLPIHLRRTCRRGSGSPISRSGRFGPTTPARNRLRPSRRSR